MHGTNHRCNILQGVKHRWHETHVGTDDEVFWINTDPGGDGADALPRSDAMAIDELIVELGGDPNDVFSVDKLEQEGEYGDRICKRCGGHYFTWITYTNNDYCKECETTNA